MADTITNLDKYPDLIKGFDHLRAGRYFELEEVLQAIEGTNTGELVQKYVPGWDPFIIAYLAKLSKTRLITRIAKFLKVFELSVLASYVTLLGINLFSEVSWMDAVLPWATVFVFVFFGFIYGVTFFFVEKPTERYLENFLGSNKKFARGLYKLVCNYVEDLDKILLQTGSNAEEYSFPLCAKDYPGIFVTSKPSRVGDRNYRAVPYPLHTVLREKRSKFNVLMLSYRDDRLLKALSDKEGKFQVNLVATSNISGHGIFKNAVESILQNKPRSKVSIVPSEKGKRAVALLTVDGAWELDVGRSLRPNELKYTPVREGERLEELKKYFSQGLLEGEKFKLS
jgi:hypothetical protein